MPTRRICTYPLNVVALRRWIIYKPLAILLTILLLPTFSWMKTGGPFQAHAQTLVSGCTPGSIGTPGQPGYIANPIIQNYCDGNGGLVPDLFQLETDAVSGYLAVHGLPASDAHIIYDYGRQDLRDGVRSVINLILDGIILKNPASRSTHEQALFNWLQSKVWHNEILSYQLAIGQFHSFQSDPCDFTLDPNIASAYNIAYDGTPFCFGGLQSNIFSPPVPAEDYFTTYGLIHAYTPDLNAFPYYASLFTDTSLSTGAIWGIGLAGGVGFAAAASIPLGIIFSTQTGIVAEAGFFALISEGSIGVLGVAGSVLATVIMPAICVTIGIMAGIEIGENQKTIDDLNNLSNTLTQVQNTPPDLVALVTDAKTGQFKLQQTIDSATVPEVPSTATLPGHQTTDLSFSINVSGSTRLSTTLQYKDWNNHTWTAQTFGGWFDQSCTQGASTTSCYVNDSINADLRYVDWTGANRTASRNGSTFTLTKASPDSTGLNCKPDPATGVSNPQDFSKCNVYVFTSIQMLDEGGVPMTVSLTPVGPPFFADPGPLSFGIGVPATKTITVGGNPTATVCWTSGQTADIMPPTSHCTSGSYPVTFDGNLNAPTGSFNLQLSASNSFGTVTQSYPVTVSNQLAIVSKLDCTTFPSLGCVLHAQYGQPFTYTVVATGNPTPKLSLDTTGNQFNGLTFTDNGDGTATLSGTPVGSPFAASCDNDVISPCGGFVAKNSQGTVEQNLVFVNAQTPQAQITDSPFLTFNAGVLNTATLHTTGETTKVSWIYQADPNAPWLNFNDNGDGTATLSGTPPSGNTGFFTPAVEVTPAGALPTIQHQVLQVVNNPQFSNPDTATFTVGVNGDFDLSLNTGTITTSTTMPQGLTFGGGNRQGKINGTPAAGTGGQYTVHVIGTATSSSTTQDLTLNVNEAPKFISPNLAVLFANHPSTFTVTTTGFPNVSTNAEHANSGPPINPGSGDGMYIAASGLLKSQQASNLNSVGQRTGTLTITGTPASGDVGTHQVQITAQNAVGSVAQQALTLQVLPYSPTAQVNLLSNWTFARDSHNNVVATVVLANNGSTAAQNVTLTSGKIGAAVGTVAPAEVASIPAESTATFNIVFPAASVGAHGTAGVLTLTGTYTGGTFNNAGRIILP